MDGDSKPGRRAKASRRRTVVFGPLQDGGRAGDPVPDAGEGQHLELVQHELAQTRQERGLRVVPADHVAPGLRIQISGAVQDLSMTHGGGGGAVSGGRCARRGLAGLDHAARTRQLRVLPLGSRVEGLGI